MSRNQPNARNASISFFDQARDELFSHILRCGVLKAALDDQKEWFDDTMDYLAERYEYLTDEELDQLRTLGERYCRPVINRSGPETAQDPTEAVGASR